jgi:RHS repeat-associated protein
LPTLCRLSLWKWEQQEPFGNNPPNEDPDGNSELFEFNLRLPEQCFDKETNLAYDIGRDYDPAVGRYVQSDPIGLMAGLNTYAHADSDSLRHQSKFLNINFSRSARGAEKRHIRVSKMEHVNWLRSHIQSNFPRSSNHPYVPMYTVAFETERARIWLDVLVRTLKSPTSAWFATWVFRLKT